MAKQTAETLNLITKWTKNCELVIPWPIPDLLNKVLLILCYSGVKNKLAKTEISFEKRTGCLQGKAKGTLETQNTFMIQHEQKKYPLDVSQDLSMYDSCSAEPWLNHPKGVENEITVACTRDDVALTWCVLQCHYSTMSFCDHFPSDRTEQLQNLFTDKSSCSICPKRFDDS